MVQCPGAVTAATFQLVGLKSQWEVTVMGTQRQRTLCGGPPVGSCGPTEWDLGNKHPNLIFSLPRSLGGVLPWPDPTGSQEAGSLLRAPTRAASWGAGGVGEGKKGREGRVSSRSCSAQFFPIILLASLALHLAVGCAERAMGGCGEGQGSASLLSLPPLFPAHPTRPTTSPCPSFLHTFLRAD